MAQIVSIKRRIKSTKNVSQITYAMQMVAASKMRKSQAAAVSGQPYAQAISSALSHFSVKTDRSLHPLLKLNSSPHALVILISTDKGLCGGLNLNLFKLVQSKFSLPSDTNFVCLGKKAENFLVKASFNLVADFPLKDHPQAVSALSDLVTSSYAANQYGQVHLAFNRFVSALKQEPTVKTLLPVPPPADLSGHQGEFTIEPDPHQVIDALLKAYVENQIKDALNQSQASEFSARMLAMKSATDSARELLGLLTLEYNRARQEKITSEISDIVTARLSVK